MATNELTDAERAYLEMLIWLSEAGLPMTAANVARAMRVSAPSVHEMIGRLERSELITRGADKVIAFTPEGERQAQEIVSRHRLIERFLTDVLGIPWDEVHEEAEHMEHAASERLIDRIDNYLGYPAVDPHGDPIPRADGSLAEIEGTPLSRCRPGQQFRVVRVMDQDPAFLRYLSECGLDLHATGELLENRPEAGAVVCRLGERSIALGLAAAGKVLVSTDERDVPSE